MPSIRKRRVPKRFKDYEFTLPNQDNVRELIPQSLELTPQSFLELVNIDEIEKIVEETSFNDLIENLPYTIEVLEKLIAPEFPEGFFEGLSELLELPEGFFEWLSELPELPESWFEGLNESEASTEQEDKDLQAMFQYFADEGIVLPALPNEDLFLPALPNEDLFLPALPALPALPEEDLFLPNFPDNDNFLMNMT